MPYIIISFILTCLMFSVSAIMFKAKHEDKKPEAQIIQIKCIDRVTTLVIQEGDKTYHVPAYDSLGEFRCKK